jgi:ketosteroid isomerase-like protein
MKCFPVTFVVFITTIGYSQSKVDLKAEEAAIRKTDSAWQRSSDPVSFWSDDAVIIAPGQPAVRGKVALRKMVEDLGKTPGFSIRWKMLDLYFSPDGKIAYGTGENMITMNDSTGKRMNIPGRVCGIWRKEADGSWKCVLEIWNNPPAQ